MTKLQQNKRFVFTIVIVEILTLLISICVFGFMYYQSYDKKFGEQNALEAKLKYLSDEEVNATEYIKIYETSSDLKKSNTIILNKFESVANQTIKRVSNLNPFFNLTFIELIESEKYLNVVDVKFSVSLKDESLDPSFMKLYGDIMMKSFKSSIESKQFYNLRQISDDTYIVTYQKKIEGDIR